MPQARAMCPRAPAMNRSAYRRGPPPGMTSPCPGTSAWRQASGAQASCQRPSGPPGTGPVTTASGGWLTIETQNVNVPASLLPEDGLHTGRHRPVRLPGSPGRGV